LTTARLVDELEVEQHRLVGALVQLLRVPAPHSADGQNILQNLDQRVTEIRSLAEAATSSEDQTTWNELVDISGRFAQRARSALGDRRLSEEDEQQGVLELYNRFVHVSSRLIEADATRAILLENQIEAESKDLLTVRFTNDSFRKTEWQAEELNRVSWHMLEGEEAAARRLSHMHRDSVYVREILRAGARGYPLKDSMDADLLSAVRSVPRGEGFISPAVSEAVLRLPQARDQPDRPAQKPGARSAADDRGRQDSSRSGTV
jgi:hypothetical protein